MRTIDRSVVGAIAVVLACGLPSRASFADSTQSAPGSVASTGAVASTAGLAAAGEDGLISASPGVCSFDFGSVSKFEAASIEHVFTVVNNGTTPVKIDQAHASCGCTSALLGNDGQAVMLQPGESVRVKVAIDLSLLEGAIHKSVFLYSNGEVEPRFIIRLSARIEEAVSLSPELIDFGKVRAKGSPEHAFSLVVDARVAPVFPEPGRRWPVLQCSNPDVSIVPTGSRRTGKQWIFDYLARISPRAPIGAVTGTIGVSPVQFPTGLVNGLQRHTVTLGGEIEGDIAAVPNTVVLGTVTQGHDAGSSLTVYGDGILRVSDLKIGTTSSWIAASLKPIPPGSGIAAMAPGRPALALLEITLKAKAPLGLLSGRVEIVTSGGERLAIPLLCYIVKAYP